MREGFGSAHLVARAGRKLVALSLADVVEIMRPLPVSNVHGAPQFVLGAGLVRGSAVPVIDARSLLGEEPGARPAGRWISLRLGTRRAALAVDEVVGTRALDHAAMEVMPPLLRSAPSSVAETVAALDEQLVLLLRAGRLVPEAVWDAVEDGQRR